MKRFILCMSFSICTFIFLVVLSHFCISIYISDVEKQAIKLTGVLNEYVIEAKAKVNEKNIDYSNVISHFSNIADCRICIFSKEGTLLIDTDKTESYIPQLYTATNTISTKNGIFSNSISSEGNNNFLNEFSYLDLDEDNSFIICVSIPLSGLRNLQLIQKWIIFTGCMLLIIITLFYILWQKSRKYKITNVTEPSNDLKNKIKQIELYTNERISLLSTVLSNIDNGIILFDVDCSILMMNPRAQFLTGAKSSLFFPDRPNPDLDFPPVLIKILEMVKTSMESKNTLHEDFNSPSGKILSIHTDIVYSKYIPYTFYGTQAFITDVTEKRQMQKIRDEFVSNVSHELRTPLTLISGFAETLQNWKELDDNDCERAIEIIDIESKRLTHMISQLLDLSHIESQIGPNTLIPMNPIQAIKSVSSTLQALADKHNINLKIDLTNEKLEILGDKISIIGIVTNLCENAVKYTPSGGNVLLSAKKGKENLRILVKDNGIGIQESEITHIFERFYRVEKSRNSKYGGSGLGLSITKNLVDKLSGNIYVKSRLHYGSTFIVDIPLFCDHY